MPKADPANVRLLILDVDGCLTDGSVHLDGEGRETKRYNIKDGLGISVWLRLGLPVVVITGRTSDSLIARCRELGITELHQGVKNKGAKLAEVLVWAVWGQAWSSSSSSSWASPSSASSSSSSSPAAPVWSWGRI